MKKNLTELVFILDKSGSMSPLTDDTIGGFNSLLDKQKNEEGDALVTTVLFNHEIQVLHNRIPIEHVSPINRKDYTAMGMTSLLDAMGSTIDHIKNEHIITPNEERPEKVMFVIITDGAENSSKEYNIKQVKNLINTCKGLLGWEFLFLGANIDAIQTAGAFGIDASRAVNYNCDKEGTALNYKVISKNISDVRQRKPISDDWKADIEKDFEARSNNASNSKNQKKSLFNRSKKSF
ncbi:vWA domain-containing protein [Intestinibacter sp.]|uniref:vWA domain-containing protein n=1 Tax=Intestinibacter sp. TaxID=1965304 RepID=UPI003F174CC0